MANGDQRLVSGFTNFAGGVDSSKVATLASAEAPQGLLASQLAWLINGSVRGGGITPRGGVAKRATMPATAKFQGGVVYDPFVGSPYGICSIGGRIYQVQLEVPYAIIDLSERFQLFNPPDVPKTWFQQGAEFLVIQAGDYVTLPLFWDGVSLWRSRGYVPNQDVLDNPQFTVPAIGEAALVTLGAAYDPATLPTNGIVTINGYRYQQVDPNQRVDFISTIFRGAGIAPCITGPVPVTLPAGLQFPNIFNSTTLTMLFGTTQTYTPSSPQSADATPWTGFVMEVPPPGGQFRIGAYMTDTGCPVDNVFIAQTPNPLASPGANEVWLLNLDDPRQGTVLSIASQSSQLPAGGPMDYYMGRFWIANGREYLAGDIIRGPSGSAPYEYRDSILYVSENEYLASGGTFSVPENSGNITALRHNASLDTATGEGILFVFTSGSIFSCNVTPVRATWILIKEPLQRVVQINHGTQSDRSIAAVNGDLFFRRIDGVGSLITAIRYFNQWANPPLSNEEQRVLSADEKTRLSSVSGIEFDSKLLMTCLPIETDVGIAHQGIMPLDFLPIASAREQLQPVWEGLHEGLDILQLLKGNFDGEDRAFAFVVSRYSGNIELWELTRSDKEDTNDSGEARITWVIETPGYVFRNPNQLKQWDTLRIAIDRLYGRVDFTLYWRNDQNACWNFWNAWSVCAARNNCEDPQQEFCPYPTTVYKEQYRAMMRMPSPVGVCDQQSGRPSDWFYSSQLRLVTKGYCRVLGFYPYAWQRTEEAFSDLVCVGDVVCGTCDEGMPGPPGLAGQPGSGMRRYVLDVEDPNGSVNGNQGDEVKSLRDGRLWTKTSPGSGSSGWE